MALTYPAFNTLSENARAELRRRKPAIDPTVFGSFARPFMDSASALAYSNTLLVRDLEKQLFPQTAEGDFLARWGGYEDLPKNPATGATGFISIGGTVGEIVPALTLFSAANGLQYQSNAVASVQTVAQSIASLVRSGSTVTATTASPHTLATGIPATIAGAGQTEYNGTFDIVVTGNSTFTYSIDTTPATPATGSISVSGDYAVVSVTSTTAGLASNLSAAAVLTLVDTASLPNIDASGYAQFDGITGGAEIETDDEYRARILLSRSIIEGVFTADQVELAALSISGNTRAFVIRPSLSVADPLPTPGFIPAPGQVAVYILRDNDANIIPSQAVLNSTKAAVIANGKLPANTAESDVFVLAPVPVAVNFVFTSITPDTPTMRTAVTNSLSAFFQDGVTFEGDVSEGAFLGAIQNTQDLETGDFLQTFVLSSPSANVDVDPGEIAVLGSVSF